METELGKYTLEDGEVIVVNGVRIINYNGKLYCEKTRTFDTDKNKTIEEFRIGDTIVLPNGNKLELTRKGNLRIGKSGLNSAENGKGNQTKKPQKFPQVIVDTSKPEITPDKYSANDDRYSRALEAGKLEELGQLDIAQRVREELLEETKNYFPRRGDRNRGEANGGNRLK